jgi:glycosyltransferase involved in cell wall biosynthesis
MLLSIIIPMFNEEHTIKGLLSKLHEELISIQADYEIIVVDDCSTDESLRNLQDFRNDISIISLLKNKGKGNAVRIGIKKSAGKFIIVQDSDLEYDPRNILSLLNTAIDKNIKVVYGSRVKGTKIYLTGFNKFICKWPNQQLSSYIFNFFLTFIYFIFKRVWISDLLTGYKLYDRDIFSNWQSKTNGFETDHEITNFIVKSGIKIFEIPINYIPRTKSMGKKIGFKDAISALKICVLE